jgi:hypothetical protein
MTNFFNKIKAMCQASSVKREIQNAENEVKKAQEKLNALKGNVADNNINEKQSKAKSKANVTCSKDDLIINVAANVQVKDICRNIERKLKRNLNKSNEDDMQLLYNHLYYFYSIKHINTLPIIHGKNKDYHINDYVSHRTNSVINDVTCHITFGK